MFRNSVTRNVNYIVHNRPLELDEVRDCSIHGLNIGMFTKALLTHFKFGSAHPPIQPLGRWGVSVDNFSKGYHYDHTI